MRGALIAVVGSVLLLNAVPADAQLFEPYTTGTGSFQCAVSMPDFPTDNGPPVTCSGRAIVTLTGTFDTGGQYVLAGVGVPLTASADWYRETCTLNQPLNGFTSGVFTISGLIGSGGGATMTGGFVWTRIGVTGLVLLPRLGSRISFNDGRTSRWISNAQATAVFRPVSPLPPPSCSAPGGPVIAHIVGVANWYL